MAELSRTFDYVIVGGGPAGLSTAILAAQAGASAVVIERGRGAVDKACGEGLMPPGVAWLQRMGVEVPAWGTHPFVGIRYIDGPVVAEAAFPEGPGLGVRRLALSEGLRARAQSLGVALWSGCEALSWTQSDSGVTVETSRGALQGRWLVAADGLHSRIRKEAGIPTTTGPGRRLGIRRHFTVKPWSQHVEVWWGDGVEAYVTPTGPDRVGVAFLWSRSKGDYETFLQQFPALAAKLGPPESTLRGAGPFDVQVARRVQGRVLLVGDAAGYLDAITGEGISLAFEEAHALILATQANDPARYEADWWRITRRHRFLTRSLLWLSRHPRLRARLIRALARAPASFGTFLALNTGSIGYLSALPAATRIGVRLLV